MSSFPTSDDGSAPVIFHYRPNAAAACIFIAGFGLGTLGHFFEMIRLRSWYFIPFLVGCVMETFGYYGRFWLSQDPQNFKAYVLYILLVLPAPIFLAATMYMSIRRIIEALKAEELSPMRPAWMSKLFVMGDIVCFLVQISGVGMGVTTSASLQHTGAVVVVIGLVIQILVFLLFVTLTWRFYKNCSSRSASKMAEGKRYIVALLVASIMIVLRNLVQGIEHASGSDSYVAAHEAFAYIFEALPLFIVVCLFLVWHPGRLTTALRSMKKGRDRSQESMEMGPTEGLNGKSYGQS